MYAIPWIGKMARLGGARRLWLIILLVLVAVALPGHIFAEAADAAHGLSTGTGLSQPTACLHTGALLPDVPKLPLDVVPHFELHAAAPTPHDVSAPILLRPPIRISSH